MMESTRRSFLWQAPNVNASTTVCSLMGKALKMLIFILTPADTTENFGKRGVQISSANGITLNGSIKSLFWIAVSITLGILAGQLS